MAGRGQQCGFPSGKEKNPGLHLLAHHCPAKFPLPQKKMLLKNHWPHTNKALAELIMGLLSDCSSYILLGFLFVCSVQWMKEEFLGGMASQDGIASETGIDADKRKNSPQPFPTDSAYPPV